MMNIDDIIALIDRFYRGETSIDEERWLISFLLSDDCPEELQTERHAIVSLARKEAIAMPDGLEREISSAIHAVDTNKKRWWWLGIASGLLLIIGIAFWALFPNVNQPNQPQLETVAEIAKPAETPKPEAVKPRQAAQSASITHRQTRKAPTPLHPHQQADLKDEPANMPEIDIVAEVADILANIDQLEQQILVTNPQNND